MRPYRGKDAPMRREGCTHPTAWVRGWCRIDATIHMHACTHPAAWARPSRRGVQASHGIGARMPAHPRGLGLACEVVVAGGSLDSEPTLRSTVQGGPERALVSL